jgi:hypothetical protein
MPKKLTPKVKGEIVAYLGLKWSYSRIIEQFKGNVKLVKSEITRVKRELMQKVEIQAQTVQKRVRKTKLSKTQILRLKYQFRKKNPLSQRKLGAMFGVTPKTIRNYKKKFGLKVVHKAKVHALSPNAIEKRRVRSYPLYMKLNNGKWKNYITSDEAGVYLRDANGIRNVQYLRVDQDRDEADLLPHEQHPRGVMVWCGLSENKIFKPIFVQPGAKINSDYYQARILQPFMKEAKQHFGEKPFCFHQDSAPAHASKSTQKFLKDNKFNFLSPDDWIPNSPDCAPCDFFYGDTLNIV